MAGEKKLPPRKTPRRKPGEPDQKKKTGYVGKRRKPQPPKQA